MKISYFIGLLLLINAQFCYSQSFIIDKKYAGAQFVKGINVGELINRCYNYEQFWDEFTTNQERENHRTLCPLNTTEVNFNKLYDLIDKKTVIYRDGDLELVMDRKNDEVTSNNTKIPIKDIVYEVNLSLVYKQQIKDTITLASYSYNPYRAFYLNSTYYYIDSNGSIYTLSLNEYADYIKSVKYKHYQIDKENLCFKQFEQVE